MGRLSDYIKSFFGVPQKPSEPNDLPSYFEEDFSRNFGNFPQHPGPKFPLPEFEWHIFQDQVPDIHEFPGDAQEGDLFSQMEQMLDSFFRESPFSSPENFFNGPSIIQQLPLLGDSSEPPHQPPSHEEPGCQREKMLIEPDSHCQDFYRQSSRNDNEDHPSIFHTPHSWFGGIPHQKPHEKIDRDLDDELESGQISLDDILSDKQEPDNSLLPTVPRFSSQSYSSITKIDSQGNREIKTTRRDSSGREEVTVVRKSGNKEHIIKTWKNEDGSEQTQENVVEVEPDSRIQPRLEDRFPLSSIYENIIGQFFPKK